MKSHIGSKRAAMLSLLGILAAATIGGYIQWRQSSVPSVDERYATQPVRTGPITQTVSANGTLNPVVLVQVGTQVSGTVKKLGADFNDRVTEGQVLVELDDSLLRAQVRQSEAGVHNAQASLDLASANDSRANELYRRGFLSKQGRDQTLQAVRSARAQLALATAQLHKDRTNLGYAVIRSPVSGVVVDRQIDVGQTVAASFQTPTLFRIAKDLRQMQIDSSFAEADIGSIRVGQPVLFKVDAFPNRLFQGQVKLIRLNPTIQQNVVTYNVVVLVDNPDEILMPGMTAYVNIVVAQRNNALLVPNAALRFKPVPSEPATPGGRTVPRTAPAHTVYVVDNGQLRRVDVVTGIANNLFTEVTSRNLKPGDRVVTEDRQAASTTAAPASRTFRMRVF